MGVTGRKSLARTLPLRPGATLATVLLGATRGESKLVGGSSDRAGGAASESGAGLVKQVRSEVIKTGPVMRDLKNLWPEPWSPAARCHSFLTVLL